jgi:branched-chain amino acid transport system permease protein
MVLDLSVFVQVILLGGIYSLISIALNLQYSLTRTMNVAYGEFMMINAYITFWLFTLYSLNPLLSILATGTLSFALGLLIYALVLRRLLRVYKVLERFEERSLLAAFGFLYILQSIATILWPGPPKNYLYMNYGISFLTTTIQANRLVVFIFATLASLLFLLFLKGTLTGKAMRAMMSNQRGAMLLGIRFTKLYALAFALGLMMAGIAGSLVSMLFAISSTMGTPFTTFAFIVMVLGGLGNVLGSLIAAFIIAGIYVPTAYLFNPGIGSLILYVFFALILVIRPQGLLRG